MEQIAGEPLLARDIEYFSVYTFWQQGGWGSGKEKLYYQSLLCKPSKALVVK